MQMEPCNKASVCFIVKMLGVSNSYVDPMPWHSANTCAHAHMERQDVTRHLLWLCECTWKCTKYATAESLSINFKIWAEHFSEYLILMQSHITVSMSIIPVQCSEVQRI